MRKYQYGEQTIKDINAFSNNDQKIVQYALESNHQMLRDMISLRISQYRLQVEIKKDRREREKDAFAKERLWDEIDELQDRIFLGYNIIEETYEAVNKEIVAQMQAKTRREKIMEAQKNKGNRQKFANANKNKTREK